MTVRNKQHFLRTADCAVLEARNRTRKRHRNAVDEGCERSGAPSPPDEIRATHMGNWGVRSPPELSRSRVYPSGENNFVVAHPIQQLRTLTWRRQTGTTHSKMQIIRWYIHLKFVTGHETTHDPLPAVGASWTKKLAINRQRLAEAKCRRSAVNRRRLARIPRRLAVGRAVLEGRPWCTKKKNSSWLWIALRQSMQVNQHLVATAFSSMVLAISSASSCCRPAMNWSRCRMMSSCP